MKVLVTGGTGYLGRAIVRALVRQNHSCVVFARAAIRSGLPGRLVDGDVRDRAAIDRAADGVDAICHAAALVSIWRARSADFDDVNVGGLENVIAVCRARGLARLVYTSSFLALPPADQAPGTDAALLDAGYATVTSIQPVNEAARSVFGAATTRPAR